MIADEKLDKLLRQVEKPARYTGGEMGIAVKDPEKVDVRFAFAFPDLYEIGMSYLGLQILYDILNREDKIYCERVFAPAPDMLSLMEKEGLPLFTLETKTPVREMDFLGFTLQYEMSFATILKMIELGGIPVRSSERTESDPLIIAGGPCAFNPEPLADFVDIFIIGDGEESLPKLLLDYASARKRGSSKHEFLRSVSGHTGIYVPAFYSVSYNEDGTVREYKRLWEQAPARVRRCIVESLNDAPFPTEPIVPFIETVHDRATVETFRGCTKGCRFCQAGMIYRPVRERSRERIMYLARKQLSSTGHGELSLLSLSTSDYSEFEPLAMDLVKECRAQNVSLSLPSLRLDNFSFKVLDEIQRYKKSGLTFAPEAGTQRLRDVINKGISEKDIYGAVRQAVMLGWKRIKLYFMIGLPTETYEDLDGIAGIAEKIMEIYKEAGGKGRFDLNVSVSNFVPKAHTPFQWVSQDSTGTFTEKHDYLKKKLKIKGVSFSYHDSDVSAYEAVFARGDRRTGRLLEEAYRQGCYLDGWTEYFDPVKWRKAVELSGTDMNFYTVRKRSFDEILPWNIIDPSVTTDFLRREAERAERGQTTPDCRYGCTGCGINRRVRCEAAGILRRPVEKRACTKV